MVSLNIYFGSNVHFHKSKWLNKSNWCEADMNWLNHEKNRRASSNTDNIWSLQKNVFLTFCSLQVVLIIATADLSLTVWRRLQRIVVFLCDSLICENCANYNSGGGGGALLYKPIRDVPFFRVSFFSINAWMGYKNWSEIPKRVMTVCSRTKGYCFQEQ